MARPGDLANPKKASNGSQFYIVLEENACRHLDGEYTVFGETVEGFDVLERIAKVQTDSYDRPLWDIKLNRVRVMPAEDRKVLIDKIEAREAEEAALKARADSVANAAKEAQKGE